MPGMQQMTADRRVPQCPRATDVPGICAAWFGARPRVVRPVAITGFSGGRLAVVDLLDSGEAFVVKAFRHGLRPDRVAWVHGFMRQARAAGVDEVPELAVTAHGATWAADPEGVLWEAVRFVEGVAVTVPDTGQVMAAMDLLARLHRAAERLADSLPATGISGGVQRRIDQVLRLRANPWPLLEKSADVPADAAAAAFVRAVVARLQQATSLFAAADAPRVLDRIAAFPQRVYALQPVLRDVWSAHVLFAAPDAARVAGLVDFHAAAVDVPATDIARLLGSWLPPAGRDGLPVVDRWPEALPAYERVRPLPAGSREFVTWLDATGVVCGLDNWFRWVLSDGRLFPAADAVLERVDRLLERLPAAIESLSK